MTPDPHTPLLFPPLARSTDRSEAMSKYTPDQITFWMDNFTSVSEGYEERETRLYNVGVVRGLIAELTRLRTANAALRAEWKKIGYIGLYSDGGTSTVCTTAEEVASLYARYERIVPVYIQDQLTDTTPGAMED